MSAAAVLLGLRVRMPPGALISVPCECCQVEVSASVDTRPEESYRMEYVWV